MAVSLLRHLYYDVKPYLPVRLRMAFRRYHASRLRPSAASIWPILPGSSTPPPGWMGWPEGKSFAFVLTHDVEGQRGLDQTLQLASVEKEFGFRSSFNFVPEGEYETPASIREALAADGFEVGVHDLRHDGKLYRSRSDFAAQARRINHHLRTWQASGFRSGFMHHNLDWLDDLDIQYDMSTFDTDPFEPQPDGVDTIFPFWVAGKSGRGFVEMPYTLPQDSTLYLVLNERTIDIWKQKLDWVAQNRGMALLNVHPDYINFADSWSAGQYPIRLYRELLAHVRQNYSDSAWQVLPSVLARHVKAPLQSTQTAPSPALA